MEIPVYGFMFLSDESAPIHSHHLYVTSWDGSPVTKHVHELKGVTSFEAGHNHIYLGTTEPARNGVQHIHRYFTVTSINDKHGHHIHGFTGPAILLPGIGHYHEFRGVTSTGGTTSHSHSYGGRTSL